VGIVLQHGSHNASWAVMMATPGPAPESANSELIDLAWGLLFTEGLIQSAQDVTGMSSLRQDVQRVRQQGRLGLKAFNVYVQCSAALVAAAQSRQRQLAGNSGCGLCGLENLEAALPDIKRVTRNAFVAPELMFKALSQMQAQQKLWQKTGGSHAAALVDAQGKLLVVREDIGRHNALDKCIGHLLRQGKLSQATAALVSSRASAELVIKCMRADLAFLGSVSAASGMAQTLAQAAGITLVSFMRSGHFKRVA
jgi:FdhD protein